MQCCPAPTLSANIMHVRFGGGVPCKQYKLIHKDGLRISQYIARTLDGAAMHSHMRKDNYFYFNCCTGRFARESCPSYLTKDGFQQLKGGAIDKLEIMNGVFMQALMARKYTKVRLLYPPILASLCCIPEEEKKGQYVTLNSAAVLPLLTLLQIP